MSVRAPVARTWSGCRAAAHDTTQKSALALKAMLPPDRLNHKQAKNLSCDLVAGGYAVVDRLPSWQAPLNG